MADLMGFACSHEGGTGCPDDESGRHYYAHIDPSIDGRICIDCGSIEVKS